MQEFKILSEIKEYKDSYLVKSITEDTLSTNTTFYLLDYYDKYYPNITYKKEAFVKELVSVTKYHNNNSYINRVVIVIEDTNTFKEYLYNSEIIDGLFDQELKVNTCSGRPRAAYKQYPDMIEIYK